MDPTFWEDENFNNETNEDIARKVVSCRIENIKQVYTLHGEKSKTKKKLKQYVDRFEDNEMYIKSGKTVIIEGSIQDSYFLNGLNRNTLVFKKKIKHIVIRDCTDCKVYINKGTVAGCDVMYGSNVSVITSKHNFVNVEQSSYTRLFGDIDQDSLIHVTQSLDVFANQKNLKVNGYNTKPLKMVYKSSEDNNQNAEKLCEMSISPTAESGAEQWGTRLMIMGKTLSDDNDNSNNNSSDNSSESSE